MSEQMERVKAAFDRVQAALRWNFDLSFRPMKPNTKEYMSIDTSSRGEVDPQSFVIEVNEALCEKETDEELEATALHELLHGNWWQMYMLGLYRLKANEQTALTVAFERATYNAERSFARLLPKRRRK